MIETEHLRLIPCEARHFKALQQGENKLAEMLGVGVADGWLVFPEIVEYSRGYLEENPDAALWWMYLFIHKADGKLVGNGGFKGKFDETGTVEIGYAIAPAYERNGLATEAARGLTAFAFSHENVNSVQAHTVAEKNASNSILQKIGMQFVKELHDDEDGDIWQWSVSREEFLESKAKND